MLLAAFVITMIFAVGAIVLLISGGGRNNAAPHPARTSSRTSPPIPTVVMMPSYTFSTEGTVLAERHESVARRLAELIAVSEDAFAALGKPLMRQVAERAAVLTGDRSLLRDIDASWDEIGDWRG